MTRLSDEDRAYTAMMLGGCGWFGLGLIAAVVVLVVWL